MRQHFEVVARSSGSPEAVFALLADGAGWSRWAGLLIAHSSWEREGVPAPGGVGAIRRVGVPPVVGREQIVAYDPPYHLAYTLLSGQPVRDYRADVGLVPDGTGTRIVWAASFLPLVPGTGRLLRWWLSTVVGSIARRLACAV